VKREMERWADVVEKMEKGSPKKRFGRDGGGAQAQCEPGRDSWRRDQVIRHFWVSFLYLSRERR
jgi:hypothetical protein